MATATEILVRILDPQWYFMDTSLDSSVLLDIDAYQTVYRGAKLELGRMAGIIVESVALQHQATETRLPDTDKTLEQAICSAAEESTIWNPNAKRWQWDRQMLIQKGREIHKLVVQIYAHEWQQTGNKEIIPERYRQQVADLLVSEALTKLYSKR